MSSMGGGETCSSCKRRNNFTAACSNKPSKTPSQCNHTMVASTDHDINMNQSVREVYPIENDPNPMNRHSCTI